MYKVTTRKNRSAVAYGTELEHDYSTTEETVAHTGGLCVFRTLQQAMSFASGGSPGGIIWKARCRQRVPLPFGGLPISRFNDPRAVDLLWTTPANQVPLLSLCSWPTGTLAFRRVRLLEQVYPTGDDHDS